MHCRKLRDVACRTCGFPGHVARDCPDTWRRYHATTRAGDVVKPGPGAHKPDRECWCCNCGRKVSYISCKCLWSSFYINIISNYCRVTL